MRVSRLQPSPELKPGVLEPPTMRLLYGTSNAA